MNQSCAHRESGQAAVETALTMPLLMFFMMGIIQMGLLMQARNLSQYAVYRATRAGSVNHGDCIPMMHTALAALIPSFVSFTGAIGGPGSNGTKLGNVFRAVTTPVRGDLSPANKFSPGLTGGQAAGYTESIVWLIKEQPQIGFLAGLPLNNGEWSEWDQGYEPVPLRLEVRMVYWFPLRMPLIDWVLNRIVLAQWGLMAYNDVSPYAPTHANSDWSKYTTNPLAGDYLEATIKAELLRRYKMKQYSFPILVSSRMRFMTPPRVKFFLTPVCGYP